MSTTKTNRARKKVFANVTLDQAQEAGSAFAQGNNRLKLIEAKMNEAITKIRDKYQDEITELKESLEEPVEILEVFATEQKDTWGKRKSFELLHSFIGFRTGTPKVTKDKKFTWDGVTELTKKHYPNLVRTKDELDKEAIISMRDDETFDSIKKACFFDVVQEETFFVESKQEALQPA